MSQPRLVILRPGEAGKFLAQKLSAIGAEALWAPMFQQVPITELDNSDLATLQSSQGARLVVTSQVAASTLKKLVEAPVLQQWRGKVLTTGSSTARQLRSLEAQVPQMSEMSSFIGGTEPVLQELVALGEAVQKVIIVSGYAPRRFLRTALQKLGKSVHCIHVYRRLPLPPPPRESIEAMIQAPWVLATDTTSLRRLWNLIPLSAGVLALSERIAQTAETLGIKDTHLLPDLRVETIAEACVDNETTPPRRA